MNRCQLSMTGKWPQTQTFYCDKEGSWHWNISFLLSTSNFQSKTDQSLWNWGSVEEQTQGSWWAGWSRFEGSPRQEGRRWANALAQLYSEPCRPPTPPLCCSSEPADICKMCICKIFFIYTHEGFSTVSPPTPVYFWDADELNCTCCVWAPGSVHAGLSRQSVPSNKPYSRFSSTSM